MRYIDIFFIWTKSEDELDGFLQRLIALKFTHDKSKLSINVLDVTVIINGEEFETDLYCKSTDCHHFLEFDSAQPIHNKKSIMYSQVLRTKKLCSTKDQFENQIESLRSWFGKRGHHKTLVGNQIRRVLESKSEQLFENCTKTSIGVLLVVTYYPRFDNLSNTIRRLFIYLYPEEQVKKVLTPVPFVSFTSGYFAQKFIH